MALDRDPGRLGPQHKMGQCRRRRQVGIDRRGEGMDELRPFRTERPKRRSALRAEMPFRRADLLAAVLNHARMVDCYVLAALDLEAAGIAAEIDRVAAPALRLAADAAVAASPTLVPLPGRSEGRGGHGEGE